MHTYDLKAYSHVILGSISEINKLNKYLDVIISDDCQLIWQTGEKEYYVYNHLDSNYCSVHKFIERMDIAYNTADLVISRAGAIAIAEISFLKKASILIKASGKYPFSL